MGERTAPNVGSLQYVVEVLGPCRVLDVDGAEVSFSAIQRRLLCRLAVAAPEGVEVDRLAEAVWAGDPPATARAALQNQISRIRMRLGPDAIVTAAPGYALALSTDLTEVADAVFGAELALEQGRAAEAFDGADRSIRRRRGRALPDLDGLSDLEPERRRLDEVHRAAIDLRLVAALELGRVAWAVREGERLVATSPLDELRWSLLVRALDRAGRRGDALGAYERARRLLTDELGLEPGPLLRSAEAEVLGTAGPTRQSRDLRPVGRSDLAASAVDAALGGGIVVIRGESGSGKSVLVAEVQRLLRRTEARVASARCIEHPDAAARTLADLLDDLGEAIETGFEPVTGFVRALERAASRGAPVVLLVDDVDLAGPTSRAALVAGAHDERVALIAATKRKADLFELAVLEPRVVDVPPLSAEEIALMAAGLSGRPVAADDDLVGWLVEMSGGNPLLVEYLVDDPSLVDEDDAMVSGMSGSWLHVHEIARRRLRGLDSAVRSTLEVAAAIGAEIPIALLDVMCSPEGIEGAVEAGILERSDRSPDVHVRFLHGAIRRTIYSDLSPGTRLEIHHSVASMLGESGAPATVVAPHAIAAAAVSPLVAARTVLDAAAECTAQGAHADAAGWCRRAAELAAADGSGRTLEVTALVRLGDALRCAGSEDQEHALLTAADAAIELGDPSLIGEAAYALLQLGATTESGSLHHRAVELAEVALDRVEDAEQVALIAGAASLAYSMTGHPRRCRELFVQAEAAARSSSTRRQVLPFAYLALGHPADLDLRERLTEELLELADAAGDHVARFEGLQLAFSMGLQRGDGRRMRGSVAAMSELVDRVGDVGRRWALGYVTAAVAHLDGDLDRAEALATEALELFVGVSPSRALATYSAQLLPIRIAQGRLNELSPMIDDLVRDQPGVPAWHAALALSLVDAEPERARHHADAALRGAAEDFTWLAGHLIGGRAAARVSGRETLDRYRERLAPWSGLVCWQGTCAYGPVDTVLAHLAAAAGDERAAAAHLGIARGLADRLGAPVFAAEIDGFTTDPERC